ncbi:MAG: hypothetical protein IJK23_05035 [Clostridia bacterium]|nr:hypothetical protein [Clostridia bacterium]
MDRKNILRFEKFYHKGLGRLADGLNDGPMFRNANADTSVNFFPGSPYFLTEPAEGARWRLGYAVADVTPRDWQTHDYYLGGYLTAENGFNNKVNAVLDKMQCRIVALDDGSGRGVSVFAVLDGIGLCSGNVKKIRAKLVRLMRTDACEEKLCSVNVFSTHAHSCVDTQGLWTQTGKKLAHNFRVNKRGKGLYLDGPDPVFLNELTSAVASSMLDAIRSMTAGTMTYAAKDIGKAYFGNKNRPSATALSSELVRFVFTPDDKNERPAIIASMPAHPDVAGLPTTDGQGDGRTLCGEYIYYMGEVVNAAGYDFLFINGAICAIYMNRGLTNDGVTLHRRYEQSIRYGRELGRIVLSMTKTTEEIEADPLLYDIENVEKDRAESERNGAPHTLWYENWTPVSEVPVEPLLNIRLRQVRIPVTNPLMKLVGKLGLVNIEVLRDGDGGYLDVTEIGYLELGRSFRAVLVPGEYCQDLLSGGASLTAKGSFSGRDFPYPPLCEIFGEGLHAFGLANDAIGYIVPDNDYIIGDPKNHYHEFISIGEHAASSITKSFIDLKDECNEVI